MRRRHSELRHYACISLHQQIPCVVILVAGSSAFRIGGGQKLFQRVVCKGPGLCALSDSDEVIERVVLIAGEIV